jgi:CRP/FNR family cyclic AMP-dependent transcriptional regulator
MGGERESVRVLEADPGLGEGLVAAQLTVARRAVVASVERLETGSWQVDADGVPLAGFLVLQGCLTREVEILGQSAAIDFLAHGDLVRPPADAEVASVRSRVSWRVLEPTRLAVLDRDFFLAAQPWPEVTARLLERQERRAQWLSNVLAISHLPGVNLRILVLFWQFADRWGKVTGSGATVPIPLTHQDIARLVGARRPTVTTTLKVLVDSGLVVQESNRHWRLRGEPPTELRGAAEAAARPSPDVGRL